MDKRFGYYVFGGLLIGAFLGWGWSANGNSLFGTGIGALTGVALGWFTAAAVQEKEKGRKQIKSSRSRTGKDASRRLFS